MNNLNELKLIEGNGLIKVYETEEGNKIVVGRELWEGLGVRQKFADWIKTNLNNVDAVENTDFATLSVQKETANNGYTTATEYILNLDIAKEICMVSGVGSRASEELKTKSKMYRRYLIDIEKKYKNQQQLVSTSGLELQMLNLAQGTQIIGQVVQGLCTTINNMQEFVADSIKSKDLQIDQTADMIGLRDKNTKTLTKMLKEKLSDLTGRNVYATYDVYIKAKNKILKKYKVCNWEDISISRFNDVHSYIDSLEKEDVVLY